MKYSSDSVFLAIFSGKTRETAASSFGCLRDANTNAELLGPHSSRTLCALFVEF